MSQGGRPTKYTQKLADEICARLADGESLNSVCRDSKMPRKRTILNWVVGDREGFFTQYERARQAAGYGEGDRVAEVGDMALRGEVEPNAAKVAIDALKWSAARKAPKAFGDKQQHEIAGKDGGAIQIQIGQDDANL